MGHDEDTKQGFKVMDRRRFDSEGNDVGEGAPKSESNFTVKEAPDDEAGELSFVSFVMSFATQAMMQLGEIPPPPGVGISVDPVMAKQTIDILAILRTKTKGNLDEFEERMFEEILHNLMLAYVKTTKKG